MWLFPFPALPLCPHPLLRVPGTQICCLFLHSAANPFSHWLHVPQTIAPDKHRIKSERGFLDRTPNTDAGEARLIQTRRLLLNMITWIKLSEMLWNFLAGLQHQRGDDETRLTGSVYPTPHSTSSWPVAHRCNVVGTITARPATNWGRANRLGCCFTGSLKKKSIKMSFTKSNSSCHVEEMLTPSLEKVLTSWVVIYL